VVDPEVRPGTQLRLIDHPVPTRDEDYVGVAPRYRSGRLGAVRDDGRTCIDERGERTPGIT
jgi:hypothetical protein